MRTREQGEWKEQLPEWIALLGRIEGLESLVADWEEGCGLPKHPDHTPHLHGIVLLHSCQQDPLPCPHRMLLPHVVKLKLRFCVLQACDIRGFQTFSVGGFQKLIWSSIWWHFTGVSGRVELKWKLQQRKSRLQCFGSWGYRCGSIASGWLKLQPLEI